MSDDAYAWALGAFIAFLIGIAIVSLVIWTDKQDAKRDQCLAKGNQIVSVHGGRGGWVCLPK